jgi:hypothetical protein
MILEITNFDAKKKVDNLTEMVRSGLFNNLDIEKDELNDNEISFTNKEAMVDFIYKNSILKFRK